MKQKKPYILQVCGLKNTGKTKFIGELVQYLHEKQYQVAVIKHDGHEFDTKHYTEDNFQHYNKGADASVVFSNGQWICVKREKTTLEHWIERFQYMDFIIIEGCKQANYPKVEMLRKGINETPVSNPEGRVACIIDWNCDTKKMTYNRNDKELCEKIINNIDIFYKKQDDIL